MHKTEIDNTTLDAIGRKLIESDTLPSVDIDKIVSDPYLFELVTKRIAIGQQSSSKTEYSKSTVLSFLRQNALALACIAVIMTGAVSLTAYLRSGRYVNEVSTVNVPDADPVTTRPEVPPVPFVGKLSAGRVKEIEMPSRRKSEVHTAALRKQKPERQEVADPDGDFYAISASYDPDDIASSTRVIRVDMPRSTLFAMGVSVPLENGPDAVKADLLVGSDGVPRAIRVLK